MDDPILETLAFLSVVFSGAIVSPPGAPPGRLSASTSPAGAAECSDTEIEGEGPALQNIYHRFHPRSRLYHSMVSELAKQQQLERLRARFNPHVALSPWRLQRLQPEPPAPNAEDAQPLASGVLGAAAPLPQEDNLKV